MPSLRPIADVAAQLGLGPDELEPQGRFRSKIPLETIARRVEGSEATESSSPRPIYVLVTAVTPTPAGEGKTVTTLSLAMAMRHLGRLGVATLRQSSFGPTLGRKGGGAGGGAARVEPFDEALLGLGADQFAVEMANNLLAARVDDVLALGWPVAAETVSLRRVVDVNDRTIRHLQLPIGEATRSGGFDIIAASEVMAIFALARDLADLRARLGRMVPAFDHDGRPVTAEQLGAAGAMAALLRSALAPNLLQTSEGTPVTVHAGPFANLAHGCSSVIADRLALATADVVVTEAGFASDLGAEKLLDLKAPVLGRAPDVAVLVSTAQAATWIPAEPGQEPPGLANLRRHIEILRSFAIPVVVAVNRRPDDPPEVLADLHRVAAESGVASVEHHGYTEGGRGATDLGAAVLDAARQPFTVQPPYAPGDDLVAKVEALATKVYGAAEVEWSPEAGRSLERLRGAGLHELPVCVAKTHLSISHDATMVGAPSGYTFPVRDLRLCAGAGFVTVYAGSILTMPGMPEHPKFLDLDVAADGSIVGLT